MDTTALKNALLASKALNVRSRSSPAKTLLTVMLVEIVLRVNASAKEYEVFIRYFKNRNFSPSTEIVVRCVVAAKRASA